MAMQLKKCPKCQQTYYANQDHICPDRCPSCGQLYDPRAGHMCSVAAQPTPQPQIQQAFHRVQPAPHVHTGATAPPWRHAHPKTKVPAWVWVAVAIVGLVLLPVFNHLAQVQTERLEQVQVKRQAAVSALTQDLLNTLEENFSGKYEGQVEASWYKYIQSVEVEYSLGDLSVTVYTSLWDDEDAQQPAGYIRGAVLGWRRDVKSVYVYGRDKYGSTEITHFYR